MRITVVLGVVLMLATACTVQPDRQPGLAAPVGDPSRPAVTATPTPTATPTATATAALPGKPGRDVGSSASPARTSAGVTQDRSVSGRRPAEIRRTDWANVTVHDLSFCGESDPAVRFRGGSNGLDIPCLMLPRGAKPVYAEFITEEPANAPSTEDALVLVELGNPDAARQQALVPIQIDFDGRTRNARSVIRGDRPSAAGDKAMTFTSYRVDDANHVIATVKTLDGKTETRRYRQINFNGDWQRF